MTAFGRGECRTEDTTWTVEIRSVNHRFCDIKIRMPRKYGALEERIKRVVTEHYTRGHVDVNLDCTGDGNGSITLKANLALAREYHQCLKQISSELTIDTPIDLSLITSYKDVIVSENKEEDIEEVWQTIHRALSEALENGIKMREAEGASLKKDLLLRLDNFSNSVEEIASTAPQLISERKKDLQQRLVNLLDGVEIDPLRLAQEVAIMADKADVTEELVRLKSHIRQFSHFLQLDEPVGRRLDFLLQEFLREINTLASKISSAAVAHKAVDLKNELEKLREQIQNLE